MGEGSEDFKGIKQLSARNGRGISPHQQSKRGKETRKFTNANKLPKEGS